MTGSRERGAGSRKGDGSQRLSFWIDRYPLPAPSRRTAKTMASRKGRKGALREFKRQMPYSRAEARRRWDRKPEWMRTLGFTAPCSLLPLPSSLLMWEQRPPRRSHRLGLWIDCYPLPASFSPKGEMRPRAKDAEGRQGNSKDKCLISRRGAEALRQKTGVDAYSWFDCSLLPVPSSLLMWERRPPLRLHRLGLWIDCFLLPFRRKAKTMTSRRGAETQGRRDKCEVKSAE